MMTTLTKYMKKTTAIAMAAMVLSLPLASVASAHERHDAPPPRGAPVLQRPQGSRP